MFIYYYLVLYSSAMCWATLIGSILCGVFVVPVSSAPQADTGSWKGDCSAVIIRRADYGEVKLPISRAEPCAGMTEFRKLYDASHRL